MYLQQPLFRLLRFSAYCAAPPTIFTEKMDGSNIENTELMSLSAPPPYSLLHQLNLTHHKESNWYFLLSYYNSHPPPNEDYVKYKLAILNYVGVRTRQAP